MVSSQLLSLAVIENYSIFLRAYFSSFRIIGTTSFTSRNPRPRWERRLRRARLRYASIRRACLSHVRRSWGFGLQHVTLEGTQFRKPVANPESGTLPESTRPTSDTVATLCRDGAPPLGPGFRKTSPHDLRMDHRTALG